MLSGAESPGRSPIEHHDARRAERGRDGIADSDAAVGTMTSGAIRQPSSAQRRHHSRQNRPRMQRDSACR